MNSLRTEPEANGIDVMQELREFYHTHYYARNMRLVVLAGYELDEVSAMVCLTKKGKRVILRFCLVELSRTILLGRQKLVKLGLCALLCDSGDMPAHI